MAEYGRFLHRNGRISVLPIHFKDSKIGRNLTLISDEDEIEEDKVVLPNVANSQLRVGKKIKEKEPVTETIDNESGESDS